MSTPKFDEVERPTRNSTDNQVLYLALAETAETGKALRVPFNGENKHTLRSRSFAAMRSRGLNFHCRIGQDYYTMWATKIADKEPR